MGSSQAFEVCTSIWVQGKWGEASLPLREGGKREGGGNYKSPFRGPITAAFEDPFHAWSAVALHHQH